MDEVIYQRLEELYTRFQRLHNELMLNITGLQEQNECLEERLNILEERKRKRAKADGEELIKFQEYKEAFIKSEPHARTDLFTDGELVLWFTYVLYSNKLSVERITTFSELYKRVKGIKNVLAHYAELWTAKNNPLGTDLTDTQKEELNTYCRTRAKQYLEMMPLAIKLPDDKQLSFYVVTSQWCLNLYAAGVGRWQFARTLSTEVK